jgi:hypothetical protein
LHRRVHVDLSILIHERSFTVSRRGARVVDDHTTRVATADVGDVAAADRDSMLAPLQEAVPGGPIPDGMEFDRGSAITEGSPDVQAIDPYLPPQRGNRLLRTSNGVVTHQAHEVGSSRETVDEHARKFEQRLAPLAGLRGRRAPLAR